MQVLDSRPYIYIVFWVQFMELLFIVEEILGYQSFRFLHVWVLLDQSSLSLEIYFTEKVLYSCDANLNKLALVFLLN